MSSMEVSLIRSCPWRTDSVNREIGFCSSSRLSPQFFSRNSRICFDQTTSWSPISPVRLTLRATAVGTEALVPGKVSGCSSEPSQAETVKLYVGLPLDAVSDCNAVNHSRAVAVGLKALKLMGVEGVELPVWWGVAEKEVAGKYKWSGYLAVAEMVRQAGLKLHVSLCFHAPEETKISLPHWVSRIGESQPGIYFTDRSGKQYKNCLSLAVDELPVLNGKTPIQVYGEFCENFKSSFAPFMGSTITGISISLGPDGELRYPSRRDSAETSLGVGEFQCYDENMLKNLKQHAEALGNPLWGHSGPHDAPSYDHTPDSNTFVKAHGGSWETQYGDFFLSWYSDQLISHGDRLLSLASSIFNDTPVSGKVPLVHSWYKTRSHPSELTAGYYNTAHRNGYGPVSEVFGKNSCKMILPGMDLSDENQRKEAMSSPESLLAQIRAACETHGVEVHGQNSSVSRAAEKGFERMRRNLKGEGGVGNLFTYHRMGAYFFSPEHFRWFGEFVRSLNQPELESADRPCVVEAGGEVVYSMCGGDIKQLQVA